MYSIASQGHPTNLPANHRSREDTTMKTEEETEPPREKVKEEETHPSKKEADTVVTQDFLTSATK